MPARPSALLPLVALVVVVPSLTSCGLLGDDHLGDAFDALPSGARQVRFVDRAAVAERLGVDDPDTSVDDYLAAVADDPVHGTDLAPFLVPMAEGAAFDERDVEWSISGVVDDRPVAVYRVDDDVDLDELADDLLAAGLVEDELRERRHLRGEIGEVSDRDGPTIGGAYPAAFADTIIDEDEQLVIVSAGGIGEVVLESLDDDRDSLGDGDDYGAVLDGTNDVELAVLDTDPSCGGARVTPEVGLRSGVDALRTPQTTAYLVSGEGADQTAALQFADDDTAEADADAREAYLADGTSLSSGRPVAEQLTAELERDGDVVRLALDLEEPVLGQRYAEEHDLFLACWPSD